MQTDSQTESAPPGSVQPAGSASYDTEHRDEPICPHCGHAQGDAWEIDFGPGIEGDTTISCEECGVEFSATRHCTVTYSTDKLPNVADHRPGARGVRFRTATSSPGSVHLLCWADDS